MLLIQKKHSIIWIILLIFSIIATYKELLPRILIIPVLFLTGYTLVIALFPRKNDLDRIERILLSIGLSIAILPLLGLILNFLQYNLFDNNLIFIVLFIVVLFFTIIAYFRSARLPKEEKFKVQFPYLYIDKSDQKISIILIFLIIATLIGIIYVTNNEYGRPYTEFYILNQNRHAYDYPLELKKGETGTIIVGIINHENKKTNYTIQVKSETLSIALDDNEKLEHTFIFKPNNKSSGKQRLWVLLYKDNNTIEPYRTLYLWINVT